MSEIPAALSAVLKRWLGVAPTQEVSVRVAEGHSNPMGTLFATLKAFRRRIDALTDDVAVLMDDLPVLVRIAGKIVLSSDRDVVIQEIRSLLPPAEEHKRFPAIP